MQYPKWSIVESTYHPTFLEYEDTIPDIPHDNSYVFNTFIQRDSVENPTKRAEFVDLMSEVQQANMFCYGTMIGGNMANVSDGTTPIHPGFRSGMLSMTCGADWNVEYDNPTIEKILEFVPKIYKFGSGSYFNKPAEDMPDWKTRFWSDEVYTRLLDIKKKVDPNNYMWCHNCVGSDLGHNYVSPDLSGLPGQPVHSYFKSIAEFDQV